MAWGESAIGCDLELVEPRSEAFVRDYFTVPEQCCVGAVPDGEESWLRANLLWSAKESVLRVLETGLRRDTRSVEIAIKGAGEESRGGGSPGGTVSAALEPAGDAGDVQGVVDLRRGTTQVAAPLAAAAWSSRSRSGSTVATPRAAQRRSHRSGRLRPFQSEGAPGAVVRLLPNRRRRTTNATPCGARRSRAS